MAFFGFLGISEGLELLLLLFALTLLALFIVRRVLFSLRMRRVRRENMELARHMKKRLKSARFRSSSDFDQEDDEMFRPSVRAKALVIPASYEARVAKTRRKTARKRKTRRDRRKEGGKATFKPESKPAKARKVRKR